jgi:diaminopimelate decarboxylase
LSDLHPSSDARSVMPPSSAWIASVVRACVQHNVVPHTTHAMVMSVDATRQAVEELQAAFPSSALHTFAAKANALFHYLRLLDKLGMGCETASIGEFEMASRVFEPSKIVFDSPVKTLDELRKAVYHPCFINLDNFTELERVAALHKEKPIVANIGLRVNPQVGMGSIGSTSTGNATSKFGVGLDDYRDEITKAYAENSFLTMIHVHTGSQGIGIPLMVAGVKKVEQFAREKLNIKFLDIGGGLPVNFDSDDWTPTFAEYAEALKKDVPQLFAESPQHRIITEFGRAIAAKAGVFVSRVEYTKVNGGRYIVQQHVGADVLIRQAWAPQDWKVRVGIYDGKSGEERTDDIVVTDVAGPCCFGSDLACKERPLPRAHEGDVVVIKDLGAYAHSSFSRYNLRQAPAVYTFELPKDGKDASELGGLTLIRRAETIEETLEFMMPNL